MKTLKIIALFVFLALLPSLANAQLAKQGGDPCEVYPKQTVTYTINSATTTSLIAPVTGQNIYICGMTVLHPGGTGTMAFEGGTGATCGTTTTVLFNAWAGNTSAGTGATLTVGYGNTDIMDTRAVASSRFCALSTGTIVQTGSLVFVQGP